MERGTSFGVPPPIPGRGRPAPGFGRGVSLSAGLVIAVAVVIVLLPLWVWFFCRIEPGQDEIAILIRKTGQNLASGQIMAATPDQKGIQLATASRPFPVWTLLKDADLWMVHF